MAFATGPGAFVTAVRALRAGTVHELSIGWLITTARSRFIDHCRREARRDRHLRLVASASVSASTVVGLSVGADGLWAIVWVRRFVLPGAARPRRSCDECSDVGPHPADRDLHAHLTPRLEQSSGSMSSSRATRSPYPVWSSPSSAKTTTAGRLSVPPSARSQPGSASTAPPTSRRQPIQGVVRRVASDHG